MNNRPIRAVIFDVGGVLVRTHDQSGREFWEKRLGLSPGQAEAIVLNSEMGHRAQRGELTDEALWDWVGHHLQLGDALPAFRDDFWRGDKVDLSLVELIRQLRRNYQTAIISNATDALLATLDRYRLRTEFDVIVGSAYEGVMKPNPAIYHAALGRLGRAPEETVFIDDAPANVAGARSLGMNAILFAPSLSLARELAMMAVDVGEVRADPIRPVAGPPTSDHR